jgi:NAD(P)-dependent dehydrogenase (short-subunit alcohol dehydrogenase family)
MTGKKPPQTADQRLGCVVITGAASGIGRAIASRFLREGRRVALVDKDTVDEKALHPFEPEGVRCIQADLSSEDQVNSIIPAVIQHFGSISVLVNCAGLLGKDDSIPASFSEMEYVLKVNLLAPMFLTVKAIEHMLSSGGGSILSISSISSIKGAPKYPAYAASKGGLSSFSTSIARRYGRHNIRSNIVCPGSVVGTRILLSSRGYDISAQERIQLIKQSALRQAIVPDEIAEAVYYLCSDSARNITGASLLIDGGELYV